MCRDLGGEGGDRTVVGVLELDGWNVAAGAVQPAVVEPVDVLHGGELDVVEAIGLAGMLHDLGKSKVPLATLDKPGPLTPDEWVTIRTHPERGAAILRKLDDVDPVVLDVTLHHHERLDGSGYPHGLSGDDLPLEARVIAVADVYEALTASRPYRAAIASDDALALLRGEAAAGRLDGDCVEATPQDRLRTRMSNCSR